MKNNLFIIDTNILISAFLFKHSNTRKALDKAIEIGKLSASIEMYKEFCEVLLRPKFDKYITIENKILILKEYKEIVVFNKISEKVTVCRDPKDNIFLELALAAQASCIITGDNDLLELHPFRNIPILNAVDFLNNF